MKYRTIVVDPPWPYGSDRMVGTLSPEKPAPMQHAPLLYAEMEMQPSASMRRGGDARVAELERD